MRESDKYYHPNVMEPPIPPKWVDIKVDEKNNENPVDGKNNKSRVVINPIAVGLKWVKDEFIGK